jgi:hypothetical protein
MKYLTKIDKFIATLEKQGYKQRNYCELFGGIFEIKKDNITIKIFGKDVFISKAELFDFDNVKDIYKRLEDLERCK